MNKEVITRPTPVTTVCMTENRGRYVLYARATDAKTLMEYGTWIRTTLPGWLRRADFGKKGLRIGLDNAYLTSYVAQNLDKLAAHEKGRRTEDANNQYGLNRLSHAETPPTSNLTSNSRGGKLSMISEEFNQTDSQLEEDNQTSQKATPPESQEILRVVLQLRL